MNEHYKDEMVTDISDMFINMKEGICHELAYPRIDSLSIFA